MVRSQPSSDTGLARERTALAWNRSGLAAVVCIAVLLRRIWPLHGTGQDVALALIAASAMVWAAAYLVFAAARADQYRHRMNPPQVIYLMSAGTVVLSIGAFVLAFVSPS
jgi:uncharacterized membrane protein YidH (DUF202 family)